MFVDNYVRNITQQSRVGILSRQGVDSFCALCFDVDCRCGKGTISQEEVYQQLSYFQGLAFREAIVNGEAINVCDDLIPLIHTKGKINKDFTYVAIPKTSLPLIGSRYMGDNDLPVLFDVHGNIVEEGSHLQVPKGIYWGYRLEKFYPFVRFDLGWSFSDKNLVQSVIFTGTLDHPPNINTELLPYAEGHFLFPFSSFNKDFLLYATKQ